MRLTAMTDFGLRLLMQVAAEPQRRFTIAEVATAQGLSLAHLTKITHQLATAGWLSTFRGKGGGLQLGQAADRIRIGDVVRSLEADFQLAECRGPAHGQHCRLLPGCRLAGVLDDALDAFMKQLDAVTLADLIKPTADVRLPSGPSRTTARLATLAPTTRTKD